MSFVPALLIRTSRRFSEVEIVLKRDFMLDGSEMSSLVAWSLLDGLDGAASTDVPEREQA